MPVDQQQIVQSIYDLFYDSVAGVGGVVSSAHTYLTLAFPGIAVDEAQLGNAWSPINPTGSMSVAESLALMTGTLPGLSPLYENTSVSLERVYGEIVSANVSPAAQPSGPVPVPVSAPTTSPKGPPPPVKPLLSPPAQIPGAGPRPMTVTPARGAASRVIAEAMVHPLLTLRDRSPATRKAFDLLYHEAAAHDHAGRAIRTIAETPRYRDYLEKRALYEAALVSANAAALSQAGSRPAVFRTPPQVSSALAALQAAAPPEIQAAESTIETTGGLDSSPVVAFAAAHASFELSKQASLFQPGTFWHLCQLLPSNWFAAGAPLADVRVRSDSLHLNPASRFVGSMAPAALRAGIWRQRPNEHTPWTQTPLSGDVQLIEISYRFACVRVRRPWLDQSLLTLGGWSVPGRAKGGYSTGALQNNQGIFPLMPVSMLVTRDLKIIAQWSRAEGDMIRSALAGGAGLGLGPFEISGRSSEPGAAKSVVATFDGTTITAPGLQIVGWLNQLIPACPPQSG